MKDLKSVRIFLALFLVAVFSLVTVIVLNGNKTTPENEPKNHISFNSGKLEMYVNADNSLSVSWPEASGAQSYHLNISSKTDNSRYEQYKDIDMEETYITLDNLPQYFGIIITCNDHDVTSEHNMARTKLEVKDLFIPSAGNFLSVSQDLNEAKLYIEHSKESCINLYIIDKEGKQTFVKKVTGNELSLKDPAIISLYDKTDGISLLFEEVIETEDYILHLKKSEPYVITRDMIYDTKLVLSSHKGEGYRYNFTWNDTGDEQYTLQQKDEKGNWKDIGTFTDTFGMDVIFDEPFSETSYRMITDDKESDIVTLSNEECLLYSTIWPIKDLMIYSDPSGTKAIGTASKGRAYCIIGSENGRFEILYKDGNGYIDSSYCMVDLYEVYGDLMAYDISNSHDSLFAFHEYSIPDITDTVIRGYEDIKVGDRYVVPLLYPVCERLEKAALDAREKGYRLKIYESFRPQKATRYVHDTAKTFSEGIISGKGITYIDYITDNGRYSIDRFLANGTSRHNRGVALDLTLERDGEELHMQTVMHDLSWYSETRRNNEEAELLKEIMKGQGFAGLTSEWWHFQDDEVKERLSPPPLYEGVNIECLVKDDKGIRFRYKDGTFAVDTDVVIDDTGYHFDENGYLKKEGKI